MQSEASKLVIFISVSTELLILVSIIEIKLNHKARNKSARNTIKNIFWVLENLLRNAVDAMEGKGVITIVLAHKADNVLIDVKDTGKGISRSDMRNVFTPGFTTKKRGWGLGLSLTKRIIEEYHGGSISLLKSEPGVGTIFRITLSKDAK